MTDQDRREESTEKTLSRVGEYSVSQSYTTEDTNAPEAAIQTADLDQDVASESAQHEETAINAAASTEASSTSETTTEAIPSDDSTDTTSSDDSTESAATAEQFEEEIDTDVVVTTDEMSADLSMSTTAAGPAVEPEDDSSSTDSDEHVEAEEEDGTEPLSEPVQAESLPTEPTTDAEMQAETPEEVPTDIHLTAGETPTEPTAEVSSDLPSDAPPEPEVAHEDAPATADETTGATFTPVEEDEEGTRPRRLKDLEVGQELEGRVTSIALYGIFVDIGVGRDGLVHISEMSDTRIDTPSDLVQIGDTVQVRIKGIDVDARRISLTMRSQERGKARTKRPEVDRTVLENLNVGDTVDGVITGMAPFGAFADIGVGKDGLIHISELSEGRVDKPEDAVQVGERYTFKLLEVDPEGTRISLSLRRAMRAQKMQQLTQGQILEGTVSGLAQFGAFVDIGVGRDGLVHISELSEGRVGKVEDVVQVGDTVQVRVLEVNSQSKRISLTMRLEDRPEEPEPSETPGTDDPPQEEASSYSAHTAAPAPEPVDETPDDDESEEFSGNATLEDLLTKWGGSKRKDRRRSKDPDEEEDDEDRFSRRQRDAIRRTLQQVGNDE